MDSADWIAKRRELLDAATEGPWYWRNTQAVYLFGARSRVVMAFERMGMQGAQPVFRDANNVLLPAGKANLHDIPDARFIADARTSLPLALDALQVVLEHHRSVPGPSSVGDYCRQCSGDEYEPYPCDVVRDIEAILNKEKL